MQPRHGARTSKLRRLPPLPLRLTKMTEKDKTPEKRQQDTQAGSALLPGKTLEGELPGSSASRSEAGNGRSSVKAVRAALSLLLQGPSPLKLRRESFLSRETKVVTLGQ